MKVQFKSIKFVLLGLFCLLGIFWLSNKSRSTKTSEPLIVYSYSSFSASWGPGPILKKMFEEQCHCSVELRDADDSRLLLQRLKMEGERVGADVAVGFNQWDVEEAVDSLGFSGLDGIKIPQGVAPEIKKFEMFGPLVAFDWGLLAINSKVNGPASDLKSLEDLVTKLPNKSLALQDPRTSAPGLTFLVWLTQVLGKEGAFSYLKKLDSKIFTIASGWSASYGLFQKDQANSVFSYVTSPLYHQIEEKDRNYVAVSFAEGQPVHIEYMGLLKTCHQCERGKEFVQFLLTSDAQKVLMEKNYMLPIDMEVAKNTPWDIVRNYKVLPVTTLNQIEKKHLLDLWSKWVREH